MLSLLKNALKSVSHMDKVKKSSQFSDLIMLEGLSFNIDTGFYQVDTFPSINLGYSGGPAVLFLCCVSVHVLCIELTWGTAPAKT